MATNRVRKFRRIDDVQFFLDGGVFGGSINKAQGGGTPANLGPGWNGLVGTTLIVGPTGATTTVTFGTAASATSPGTNPDPNTLLFKDVKAQVEAAVATVKVLLNQDQQIVIVEATPSLGVTVSHTGTANATLGFDSANDTIGQRYQPAAVSNAAPCWVWADTDNDGSHVIYTWE
jgi:hypothetical protein